MQKSRFSYYFQGISFLGIYWATSCGLFGLFRLLFLLRFGSVVDWETQWPDVWEAFWVGFKFDSKVISTAMAPLLALQLVCLSFVSLSKIWQTIAFYYCSFLLVLFYIFQVTDQAYYNYFQNHIDIHIFGFLEDDTWATITSMWSEFPVLRLTLFTISICFLGIWLLYKLTRYTKNISVPIRNIALQFCFIFFCILFSVINMRGSLGIFPLTRDDLSISHNQFLNFLASNGIFGFFDAWMARKKSQYTADMGYTLSKYQFTGVEKAFQVCCQTNDNSKIQNIKEHLYRNLGNNYYPTPQKKKQGLANYHVVFIIMESWSGYYLKLHSPQMDLLGSLKDHLSDLIHFHNFFSSANGTVHSLENLLIANPDGSLIQTKYANIPFRSALARPFQQQGYQTHFITSGKLHWRNMNMFLPHQGFGMQTGKAFLETYYKNSKNNEWGVFDEYIYDYVYELLSKTSQPQFITTLSTTNHPPYQIPEDYKAAPVTITPQVAKRMLKDEAITKHLFITFQYANDALGRFISKIRNSKLRDNTIIAITGDHNTWALFNYKQDELHWRYAVPFMLYLPPKLKQKVYIEEQRFGSHLDILPTLHALAIPQAKISSVGNNLLSHKKLYFYGKNNGSGWAINHHGAAKFFHKPEYYKWSNQKHQALQGTSETPALKYLRRKAQADNVILNYSIFEDIKKKYPQAK